MTSEAWVIEVPGSPPFETPPHHRFADETVNDGLWAHPAALGTPDDVDDRETS